MIDAVFDHRMISLPSDSITLGAMRRTEHQRFAVKALDESSAIEIAALALYRCEIILAEKAYAQTLNLPDPEPLLERHELLTLLENSYVRHGLCTGPKQATLLIEQVEAEGKALAERQSGRRK